jgi:heme A synthase
MYEAVLVMHSTIRWLVIAAAAVAVARSLVARQKPWTPDDDTIGLVLVTAIDTQVLLGLALFVYLSPVTTLAVHQMEIAMSARVLRFWMLEHPTIMMVALVLVHIGRRRIRRTDDSRLRRRAALLFFGLALVAVLGGIPWPFLPYGRSLLAHY